jgi:hypothetical protein
MKKSKDMPCKKKMGGTPSIDNHWPMAGEKPTKVAKPLKLAAGGVGKVRKGMAMTLPRARKK